MTLAAKGSDEAFRRGRGREQRLSSLPLIVLAEDSFEDIATKSETGPSGLDRSRYYRLEGTDGRSTA